MQFRRDPTALRTFKQTVFDIVGIPRVILNVTSLADFNATEELRTRKLIDVTESKSFLQVAFTPGVLLKYSLFYYVADVGETNSTAASAVVVERLQQSLISGNFTKALQTAAVNNNSPSLLSANSISGDLSATEAKAVGIFHSARPTSQPSSQPSSLPSSQPSALPTSRPTFTQTTRWQDRFRTELNDHYNDKDLDYRMLHYELGILNVTHFGGGVAWKEYVAHDLTFSSAYKRVTSVSFRYVRESSLPAEEIKCDRSTAATDIVRALTRSIHESVTENIECDSHQWLISSCGAAGSSFCIDCVNPCVDTCQNGPAAEFITTLSVASTNCTHDTGYIKFFVVRLTDDMPGARYVILSYSSLWIAVVVLVALSEWKRRGSGVASKKVQDASLALTQRKHSRSMTSRRSLLLNATSANNTSALIDAKAAMLTIVNELFAQCYTDYPLLLRLGEVIVYYHEYFRPFTTSGSGRYSYSLYLLTRVSLVMFLVHLFLQLQFPADSALNCADQTSVESCTAVRSSFADYSSACRWTGATGSNLGYPQQYQTQCFWVKPRVLPLDDMRIILVTLLVVLLVRLFVLEYLLKRVLLAEIKEDRRSFVDKWMTIVRDRLFAPKKAVQRQQKPSKIVQSRRIGTSTRSNLSLSGNDIGQTVKSPSSTISSRKVLPAPDVGEEKQREVISKAKTDLLLDGIDEKDWHKYDLELQLGERDSSIWPDRVGGDSSRIVKRHVESPAVVLQNTLPRSGFIALKPVDPAALHQMSAEDQAEFDLELRPAAGTSQLEICIVPRAIEFSREKSLARLVAALYSLRDALKITQGCEEAMELFDREWALSPTDRLFRSDVAITRTIYWLIRNQRWNAQQTPEEFFGECLSDVHSCGDERIQRLSRLSLSRQSTELPTELFHLFVVDLLGRYSHDSRIFSTSCRHLTDPVPPVTAATKHLVCATLVAVNSLLIVFSVTIGHGKSADWMSRWSVVFLVALLLDVVLFELSERVWCNVVLPLLCHDNMQAVKEEVERCVDNFSAAMPSVRVREAAAVFSASDFLFVSSRVAKANPSCAESRVVLSYRNHLPGKLLGDCWTAQGTKTTMSLSLQLLEFAKWFGSLPAYIQRSTVVGSEMAVLWAIVASSPQDSPAVRIQGFWLFGLSVLGIMLLLCARYLYVVHQETLRSFTERWFSGRKSRVATENADCKAAIRSSDNRVHPATAEGGLEAKDSGLQESPWSPESLEWDAKSANDTPDVADIVSPVDFNISDDDECDHESNAGDDDAGSFHDIEELHPEAALAGRLADAHSIDTMDTSVVVRTPYRTYSVGTNNKQQTHMDIERFLRPEKHNSSQTAGHAIQSDSNMEDLYAHVQTNMSAIRQSLSLASIDSEHHQHSLHEISDSSSGESSDTLGF